MLVCSHVNSPANCRRGGALSARLIEGTGGDWDWDDSLSITIEDPALESIRERAAWDVPLKHHISHLRQLLAEAEALSPSSLRSVDLRYNLLVQEQTLDAAGSGHQMGRCSSV